MQYYLNYKYRLSEYGGVTMGQRRERDRRQRSRRGGEIPVEINTASASIAKLLI